jgi:hypothetical protein
VASTVTNYKYTFNAEFPVAGVDNDSQGFRNNFQAIKSALAAAAGEITNLQTFSANIASDNDFAGNSIKNANLIAVSTPVVSYDEGSTTVDYSRGQFHNLKLAGGNNIISIENMPGIGGAGTDQKSGSMIVAISTSTVDATTIQFAATTGTVINLGPVDLGANKDFVDDLCPIENDSSYIFEIWNDSSLNPPEIYIKKLSSNIAGTWTNQLINSYQFVGHDAIFTNILGQSLTIGNNKFTTGTYTGTIGATVISSGSKRANLALVPNRVTVSVGGYSSGNGPHYSFTSTSFAGVVTGANIAFTTSHKLYTIQSIENATPMEPWPKAICDDIIDLDNIPVGTPVTVTNPRFVDQPSVLALTTVNTTTNAVGSVYATTTTFQLIFQSATTATTATINSFSISNVLVNSITASSGTSVSSSTGAVVITNTGVLSITTSTGTIISTSTGYVVIGPDPQSNGYGRRWVETTSPSPQLGNNGDIWYKY